MVLVYQCVHTRGHPSLAEVKSPRLALTDVTDGGDPVLIKDMDAGKEVLISYVRKEAAKYARDLKCGLLELGLSVYLVSELHPSVNCCVFDIY